MTLLLRTHSGLDVNPMQFNVEDVSVFDIAHALAMLPRFGGHARFHYSVAQHSMIVAQRMHALFGDPVRTLKALLHDASDAYLTEVPRPLKFTPAFQSYRVIERNIQETVWRAFGVSTVNDASLEHVDHEVLTIEAAQLFTPALRVNTFHSLNPSWSFQCVEWRPSEARETYLAFLNALMSQRTFPPNLPKIQN